MDPQHLQWLPVEKRPANEAAGRRNKRKRRAAYTKRAWYFGLHCRLLASLSNMSIVMSADAASSRLEAAVMLRSSLRAAYTRLVLWKRALPSLFEPLSLLHIHSRQPTLGQVCFDSSISASQLTL